MRSKSFFFLFLLLLSSCAILQKGKTNHFTLSEFSSKYYSDSIKLYEQIYIDRSISQACRRDTFSGYSTVIITNQRGDITYNFTSMNQTIDTTLSRYLENLSKKLNFDPSRSEKLHFDLHCLEASENNAKSWDTIYMRYYIVPEVYFH